MRAYATGKASKLVDTAKQAIWLGILQQSDAILIRSCAATIRLLMDNVRAIDGLITEIVSGNPIVANNVALLRTIPGVGEFSAIVLLSEIGDFSAFQKPKQLAAYFGLDPTERQSGKFKGTTNKLSKHGSRYVRSILNMVAHNCVHRTRAGETSNPVLAAYFEKKRASKPHKVALCAVRHKIVNIVFAVLRDQKPFELRLPEDHNRLLLERNKNTAA